MDTGPDAEKMVFFEYQDFNFARRKILFLSRGGGVFVDITLNRSCVFAQTLQRL